MNIRGLLTVAVELASSTPSLVVFDLGLVGLAGPRSSRSLPVSCELWPRSSRSWLLYRGFWPGSSRFWPQPHWLEPRHRGLEPRPSRSCPLSSGL